MEINNVILSLAIFGRIFNGLDSQEAVVVAKKAVELCIEEGTTDPVDYIDMYEDVWAASLLAGTIHEGDTVPIHPLDNYQTALNWANSEQQVEHIHEIYKDYKDTVDRPDRYKNPRFVATKNAKNNRRKWDKKGGGV
jgi:hypothetical protein